jgi:hypothetical protein
MYATVKVGTTVRWTPVGHEDVRTLVFENPVLIGGPVDPYFEYTFNEVGTFWYGFRGLANFRGSITVTP